MIYHWFKRDLRLNDNAALYHSLKTDVTQCIFIFDTHILNKLTEFDARVTFIHQQIESLQSQLQANKSSLRVFYGKPEEVWENLLKTEKIDAIYTNEDYENYGIVRDSKIETLCNTHKTTFKLFKDHCIFAKNEVLKDDQTPYTVFTPYMKKWKLKYTPYFGKPYPTQTYFKNLNPSNFLAIPSLQSMGFKQTHITYSPTQITQNVIKNYEVSRDIPSIQGTSKLSIHFRFGTISIREKLVNGLLLSDKWVNELIWRDFYFQILHHFPHVQNKSFKPAYDHIQWRNNEDEFTAWTQGKTGYPIVDAGMRELNTTGFMHNRVRMIVASFLTKHLLINWQWGEAYFAQKLLDFELASNNGGWQWAAGSGVDAAPYFRVFNPELQTQKFDPKHIYIKQWVPEFNTPAYPKPIVDHKFARDRCLQVYKQALSK